MVLVQNKTTLLLPTFLSSFYHEKRGNNAEIRNATAISEALAMRHFLFSILCCFSHYAIIFAKNGKNIICKYFFLNLVINVLHT